MCCATTGAIASPPKTESVVINFILAMVECDEAHETSEAICTSEPARGSSKAIMDNNGERQ